jgi:hypothetical protein
MTRYRHDIEAARRRLAAREHHSIQTPYGSVQYAEHGQGRPLLFSHPLVGGFDTGLGCAESWIGEGFQVIAPSPASATSARRCHRVSCRPTRPTPTPCCWTRWASSGRPWSASRPVGRR